MVPFSVAVPVHQTEQTPRVRRNQVDKGHTLTLETVFKCLGHGYESECLECSVVTRRLLDRGGILFSQGKRV